MKNPLKKIMVSAMIFITLSVSGQFLTQDFESDTFPPTDWSILEHNTNRTWSVETKAAVSGSKSAKVSYDDNLVVQDETLVSSVFDFSTADNPQLEFSFAMSYYWSMNPNDNYDFTISIDDGSTITTVWTEEEEASFGDYEWNKATVDLIDFVGKSNLKLRFNYKGLDGANLRIDNIVVKEKEVLDLPEEELIVSKISFYPNPVKDILSYSTNATNVQEISLYNTLGKEVYKNDYNTHLVNIANLNSGIYLLKVKFDNKTEFVKIVKE